MVLVHGVYVMFLVSDDDEDCLFWEGGSRSVTYLFELLGERGVLGGVWDLGHV